jgi:dihydrofolate reductase
MRKLVIEEWISLDGHVADGLARLDFFTGLVRETYTDDHRTQFLETIDCLLMGRKTYELFAALWPDRPVENDLLAAKINHTEKIVLSGTLVNAPWGIWQPALVEPGDAVEVVTALKKQQRKNIVLWGSISLAQILMKEKLADEFHLHICPTITGGGRKLFPEDMASSSLQLIETKQYKTGIVFLRYNAG